MALILLSGRAAVNTLFSVGERAGRGRSQGRHGLSRFGMYFREARIIPEKQRERADG